jgi:HEAT repeat protein
MTIRPMELRKLFWPLVAGAVAGALWYRRRQFGARVAETAAAFERGIPPYALDESPAVRRQALRRALRHKDRRIRREAAEALRYEGPEAVPDLIFALRDEDTWVRVAAAWALGEIRDPAAVSALAKALTDREWAVRADAALALGRIRRPEAISALAAVMQDEEALVREEAAWALRQIGTPEALDVLQRATLAARRPAAETTT